MRAMIDLTRMRLGSIAPNGRRIERCPMCGQKGTISRHNDGSQLVVHKGEDIGIGLSVRDHCFIKAGTCSAAR
jgi:hypothetical protein